MSIRCKMRLHELKAQLYGDGREAVFRCVYDAMPGTENTSFTLATPYGEARFGIDNPAAIEQLQIGAEYYVDFSAVSMPEASAASGDPTPSQPARATLRKPPERQRPPGDS